MRDFPARVGTGAPDRLARVETAPPDQWCGTRSIVRFVHCCSFGRELEGKSSTSTETDEPFGQKPETKFRIDRVHIYPYSVPNDPFVTPVSNGPILRSRTGSAGITSRWIRSDVDERTPSFTPLDTNLANVYRFTVPRFPHRGLRSKCSRIVPSTEHEPGLRYWGCFPWDIHWLDDGTCYRPTYDKQRE